MGRGACSVCVCCYACVEVRQQLTEFVLLCGCIQICHSSWVCVCYVFECVCTNVYCGCCSCVHMIFVVALKERVCIKIIYLYRLMIKLYVTFNRKLHVSKCLFVCVWVRQHLEQRISDECIYVYTLIIRMLSALCYAPQIAHKQSITNNKMSA